MIKSTGQTILNDKIKRLSLEFYIPASRLPIYPWVAPWFNLKESKKRIFSLLLAAVSNKPPRGVGKAKFVNKFMVLIKIENQAPMIGSKI